MTDNKGHFLAGSEPPEIPLQEIKPHEIPLQAFESFISWIDRSEATARTYAKNIRQFVAWLKYTGKTTPTRQDIVYYRQWLSAEHEGIKLNGAGGWTYRRDNAGNIIKLTCRPNTVNLYLRSVKQFFSWTAAGGIYPNIAENIHAPKVDHTSHKKDALTPEQVLTIEESITAQADAKTTAQADKEKDTAGRVQRATEQGKRLLAMYVLAVNAGLRTIEISRANIRDIETKDGNTVIYIWGKGRTEPDQRIPLAPEVVTAIKDYLQSRKDRPTSNSPLFVSTGNRSGGKRIATTTISTMLKRAMQAAGYDSERLTAHSLRHTAGNAAQRITQDIYTTQKYMRHTDPKTTEIYIHDGEKEQERAAQLAQEVYNLYHNKKQDGEREKLQEVINSMTPAQMKVLKGIAEAMTK